MKFILTFILHLFITFLLLLAAFKLDEIFNNSIIFSNSNYWIPLLTALSVISTIISISITSDFD